MAKYGAPAGTIIRGWTVALEPAPEQAGKFRRDCGARRFACNWAVAQIKEAFGRGAGTGQHDHSVWSGWALRKRWNHAKADVAPWWAECSKEAYAGGIADAVTGLKNWHGSRTGTRQGAKVRFPRFKKNTKDRLRCTCTTGALRVEGSRVIVLPGAGQVRTAENISALWRHVRRGPAASCPRRSGRKPAGGPCRCDWRSPRRASRDRAPARSGLTSGSGTIC